MRKWELVLIVSSPPTATAVADALQVLRPTNIPVSILTFGDSREWLAFNTIHNTRKIIHLPHCYSLQEAICHGRTSALITDHLLELVNLLKPRTEQQRFFHKVILFFHLLLYTVIYSLLRLSISCLMPSQGY